MPLVRQSIPSLFGGVSQQSPSIRNPNQCEEAVNCMLTVADGLSWRPGVETIRQLVNDELAPYNGVNSFWAHIPSTTGAGFALEIPGNGRYYIYQLDTGFLVDSDGLTVEPYLTTTGGATAASVFRIQVVGTRIYVLNTQKVAAMETAVTAGSVSGVAQTLQDAALDGAADGAIWQIVGDNDNPFDTYYAKKVSTRWFEWIQPGITYQLDVDTMPHQIELTLNPLDLVTGYAATFSTCAWKSREVGDATSNKLPSFIGNKINGITFKSDRLGLLTGTGATFSETGEHLNVWRTTVTAVLDTDRIDFQVAADGASALHWAQPLGKSLILIGDRQFSLDGAPVFSPRTLSSTQSTTYPASPKCNPVSIGSNVYFVSNTASTSQIWELFVQPNEVTTDAADITAHIPTYIEGELVQLASNSTVDMLFGRRHADNKVFAYRAYWQGDEKVQSAWGRWEFDGITICSMFSVQEFLYLVYKDGAGGYHLGRINLKNRSVSPTMKNLTVATSPSHAPVHLDHQWLVEGIYNAGTNKTLFVHRFPIMGSAYVDRARLLFTEGVNSGKIIALDGTGGIPVSAYTSDLGFYLEGDHSGYVIIGLAYRSAFTFSQQFFSDGQRAVLAARTQIRTMTLAYRDTAFFQTEVKVMGASLQVAEVQPALVSTFASRTLGNEDFELNAPQSSTGTYRFPVLGQNTETQITISNDGHTPASIISAEWEGMVVMRARR